MSVSLTPIAVAVLLIASSGAFAQSGGPYEITAWTIDGGGIQNASGGGYTLSGTVGQPEAGARLSGGPFDLNGGFWPAVVVTESCPPDIAPPFGSLNFGDIVAYLDRFNAQSPAADIAPPFGSINFADVIEYLAQFNAGCP